ncbi:MAG: CPBP family intramembrane glutamic endopeptidase [Balneolaceae bacterium]|nr:CPBP family intramembrane glutamic endopeptidase [Balneolaceae bacterium]
MEQEFNEEDERDPLQGELSGARLLMLSIFSASFYLLLALLIYHFIYDENITNAFAHGLTVNVQFLIGLLAGAVAAGVVGLVITREPVAGVLDDFYIVQAISKIRFNNFDRLQLSFFAGTGEELLFRGAIQPLLGIWITSLVFVGLHGYFKFKSIGHILFGVMMFALSVMLGYLYTEAGLIAAMTAHAVYDVIMLKWMDGSEFERSDP